MAQDQADQDRDPVHLDGNRGRANRRRAARCGRRQPRQYGETDQGGDPGDQYEDHQAKERRKPAVEAYLGGLFDFYQDDTEVAGPVFAQKPGAGFDNARPAVVVVISEAANRPSDEDRKRRNHEDETPELRRLRRSRPVYPKKRAPETSEAARRLGQRSGEVRRQRRRLSPSIKRPELRRCESARKDPSRRRCGSDSRDYPEPAAPGVARRENLANGDCPQNF